MKCQPVELLEPLKLLFEAKIGKTFSVAMNSLQKITQSFTISEVGNGLSMNSSLSDEIMRQLTHSFLVAESALDGSGHAERCKQ